MFKVVLLVSVHFVSGTLFSDKSLPTENIHLKTYSNVRLVSGKKMSQGRLEVFVNGSWGTVCDDYFDVLDARVVCRSLGIETRHPDVEPSAYYGQGTGNILLDDVNCSGTESHILNCQHRGVGVHNCKHDEDVGVDCSPDYREIVRLAPLNNTSKGRVEVFFNGSWGTVCDDDFDVNDARVVCRMLGYEIENPTRIGAYYGPGSGKIWLDDVNCTGSEASIMKCKHKTIGDHNCQHSEDVGVDCNPDLKEFVRLVSTSNSSKGRLEVFISDVWGTVCDDRFDVNDARVVCRMLGHEIEYPVVYKNAFYGPGEGNIWLDDVNCTGTEKHILDCGRTALGSHNCNHSEDVGVDCSSDLKVFVRLLSTSNSSKGRVEVFINGVWGTVCDDHFDVNDARVVCRMLGHEIEYPVVYKKAFYGPGEGHIWLGDINCTGTEKHITECRRTPLGSHNCNHSDDVGVDCSSVETTASTTQVTTSHGHHDITCTESRMEFSIPLSSPHTSETATLSDPNCQINLTRTHVRGGVDLNSCGTTVQFQNDSVIFRNAIIFSAPASSSLGSNGSDDSVSQYQDIIPIECVYNRIATVHLSYMPVVRRVLFTESGVGQFSFNIQQFWDASFTSVVSDRAYPLRLEQDADIFIQLSVGSEGQPVAGHKEIGMEVQQCLVSPSSSVIEAQLHYYPLIQDGCPASSDVHIIPNTNASDSTVMRFRFRAVNFFDPSSSSSSSLVFVHCRMGLCLTGSCKPSAWTCLTPPARRVRRDVDQSRRAAHQLSTGPFLIMADEASASSSSTTATVMAVVSTSVATVAIVVAAIALIALRRRRTTARN